MPHHTADPLVDLRAVNKHYRLGGVDYPVLHDIDLRVYGGEFVAIVGPSGNGKSTLLNMLSGIDRPSSGDVVVEGKVLNRLSEEHLAVWRGRSVGIVFQFFQLLPALNLLQNVILPMDLAGSVPRRARRARALDLLAQVGLSDAAEQLPGQVSGGQQQRAAIARALANDPPLLLADEPTGNLDTEIAEGVFQLLTDLVQRGRTIVMVTHNHELAQRTTRIVEIRAGRVVADHPVAKKPNHLNPTTDSVVPVALDD